MPNIGPAEIFFVLVIALIVFGPERLPELARKVGRATSELRRMAAEVRSEFEMSLEDEEPQRPAGSRTATTVEDEKESDLDDGEDEDWGAIEDWEGAEEPPVAQGLEDDWEEDAAAPEEPPVARGPEVAWQDDAAARGAPPLAQGLEAAWEDDAAAPDEPDAEGAAPESSAGENDDAAHESSSPRHPSR